MIHFPNLTMEMKTEEKHITYKSHFVKKEQTLTIPPNTTTTIMAHVDATNQYQTKRIFTTTELLKNHHTIFANSISTVPGRNTHQNLQPKRPSLIIKIKHHRRQFPNVIRQTDKT